MTFEKDFKEAISNLPSSEKDKLILRLLKKDLVLANRLHFELLSEESVDDKRDKLQKNLEKQIERDSQNFFSPGYLTMDIRYMSGLITEHVKITKDKFGDVWLNLFLLNEVLKRNNQNLKNFKGRKAEKFYIPILSRTFKILMGIKKLHEDLQIEFKEPLSQLNSLFSENPDLMKIAIINGLNVNWLNVDAIPDSIVEIHKNIRENGFLR